MSAVATLLVIVAGAAFALWPRNDVPQEPDAVVVLGGFGQERADLGIELSQRYDAQLVLSSSASVFGEARGKQCGIDALCIDPEPETTRGEAETVADLSVDQRWDHVTVVTSRVHTTRARTLFRQCLDEVTVVGAPPSADRGGALRRYLREAGATLLAWTISRAC